MDELLQKQLIRQLKILNFWITTFGILMLVALSIIGFLLFQVIVFAQSTGERIQNLQDTTTQQLNIREQACTDGSFGEFLRNNTSACNE